MKRKLLILLCALLTSVGMWAQTDMTSLYLTNPSFETGDMTGWTSYGYNPEGSVGVVDVTGVSCPVADYPLSNSDGTYICNFYKYAWTGWWSYYTLSQDAKVLPAGNYRLTAVLSSYKDRVVSLYATTSPIATSTGSAQIKNVTIEENNAGKTATLDFTSDGSTPVILGAGLITNGTTSDGYPSVWEVFFKADNFKLYRLAVENPKAETDMSGWTTSGTIARKGDANGFDGTAGFFEFCDWNAESWTGSMTQTISNLPTGIYKVRAAGQQSTNNTTLQMVLNNGTPIDFDHNGDTNGTINSSGEEVAEGDGVAGWRYKTSPNIYISNGTLEIKFQSTASAKNRWANIDNVELYYLGQAVKDVAIALPANGTMVANTWYYKDVATTGIHAFEASNLSNIVYTTEEDALPDEVSATLPQNFLNSASTRYYFKSSSNQTLTISKICDNFSYWFLRTSDYKYLSRGGDYRSQAIADNYGIPVRIAFESNNINFIYIDNWHHLFDADEGNLFGDGDSNVNFAMEPTTGGYYIVNKNTTSSSTNGQKLYIYSDEGNRVKMSNSNATVWVLESVSGNAHRTRMQVVKDAQATSAATSAGITGITTQDALDDYLAEASSQEDISITGTGGENRQIKGYAAANNGERTVFSETKTGLNPGLYKLSVKAFERLADNDRTYDLGNGNAGISYVYAGDQKVQLWSVFDFPADAAYSTENVEKGGKNYPDGQTSAQTAFDADKYVNEVFVWVTGSSLEFGIRIPQSYDGNAGVSNTTNWICYNNFKLTYYGDATANLTVSNGKLGTFIAPFDITLPENVKAYSADSYGETVTLAKIAEGGVEGKDVLEAGTPVIVYGDGVDVNTNFYGKSKVTENQTAGALVGILDNSNKTIASGNYVLQTIAGTQAFYLLDVAAMGKLNRCYLTSGVGSSRLAILMDDDETAINAIEAAEEGEGMKDGKYLIDGQIVIVKNGVKYSANGQILK